MHIGFEGRMITWSGIGTYSRNLLESLAKIDPINKYTIFCYENDQDLVPKASNFIKKTVTYPVFFPFSQPKWRKEIKSSAVDIFHSPHFVSPLSISCPIIITIHDLIPLIIPQVMPFTINRQFYKMANKKGLKKAAYIIAVSETTKKDIIQFYNIPASKIKVIYEAASKEFYKTITPSLAEQAFERHNIRPPFVLTIGNSKPHKNWERLIKSFALITEKIPKHRLIVVGQKTPHNNFVKLVKQYKLENKVVFIDYLQPKHIVDIYNAADVFVFPSLYEGFGLPVVEAMACGTPVITSNISSLPEVAGDAGLLIDPYNVEELAEAILKITTDDQLKNSLIKKGFEQVSKFSWERTARETLKIYEEVHKSQLQLTK